MTRRANLQRRGRDAHATTARWMAAVHCAPSTFLPCARAGPVPCLSVVINHPALLDFWKDLSVYTFGCWLRIPGQINENKQ